jgi:fructose-bisphosphate aldolase class II
MSKMGMTLEIELGITGGEKMAWITRCIKIYSTDEVAYAYEELSISPRFTSLLAFETYMSYKPGNVKLTPKS